MNIPGLPSIPGLSSIPSLPSLPDFKGLVSSGTSALISFGGATLIRKIFGNQWGIFNQYGIPIMLADTVYSVKYQNGSQVSQAPVEKGTFTSYNKVQNPYQATVTMIRGGGNATMRGLFIAQLELLSKSTLLFHVITPEYVHLNAAIKGYDYARMPQDGARMIAANIYLEEVRESKVTYETKQTKNPADSPKVDGGEKQPQSVSESILSKVKGAVSGAIDSAGGVMQSLQSVGDKVMGEFNKLTGDLGGITNSLPSIPGVGDLKGLIP